MRFFLERGVTGIGAGKTWHMKNIHWVIIFKMFPWYNSILKEGLLYSSESACVVEHLSCSFHWYSSPFELVTYVIVSEGAFYHHLEWFPDFTAHKCCHHNLKKKHFKRAIVPLTDTHTVKEGLRAALRPCSRVAQRKRAGPITQRSMDRNHPLLRQVFFFFLCV